MFLTTLTISIRGQRAKGKIQRKNYRHKSCGSSLTSKTSSVSLILTHRTHWNVKNRSLKGVFHQAEFSAQNDIFFCLSSPSLRQLVFKHKKMSPPYVLTVYELMNQLLHINIKATFHLTIFMRGERATGKIQRNNCRHGSCEPSLTGKTSSVSLIFTHGTHRNVKNR